jgi:hypothetical protein
MRVIGAVAATAVLAAGITPAWACACGGYLPDAARGQMRLGPSVLARRMIRSERRRAAS